MRRTWWTLVAVTTGVLMPAIVRVSLPSIEAALEGSSADLLTAIGLVVVVAGGARASGLAAGSLLPAATFGPIGGRGVRPSDAETGRAAVA